MNYTNPFFGKRILHIASPSRWTNDRFDVERCSNWKVLMDTVGFFPMCHHYILIPENHSLAATDEIFNKDNLTMIPFPYPQSVIQNRHRFEASALSQILGGRRPVEYKKGYFVTLEMSAIDIDFVFCHQPEILSNVLWSLLNQNYSVNNTDAFTFFHWIDCPDSRLTANHPPTFFRQFEAIDRCSSVFFHSDHSRKYLLSNFNRTPRVMVPDEYQMEMKIRKMPLNARILSKPRFVPKIGAVDFWNKPQDSKVIAFNHRWNETTGRNILPDYIEGLPKDYRVYCTDKEILKPVAGYSPVKSDGRFNYAYEKKYLGQDVSENDFNLYSDFLNKSDVAVAIIQGYGTWNLSVQDSVNAGTPTLVYDTPMMREVLGNDYPLYFKNKDEFQTMIQNLPKNFSYKIPNHSEVFESEIKKAFEVSWNQLKKNKGGKFCKDWLHFVTRGLEYKKDFINQTHPKMIDGKGGNSWESIRRWCLQFGLKDDPTSRHTRLFVPDDETRTRVDDYLQGYDESKYPKLNKHEEFHWMLNNQKEPSSISDYFNS